MPPRELAAVAVAEIADMLGVSSNRVHQLIRDDPTFPAHAQELKAGKIWRKEDVEAWIVAREARKAAR